jgi:hypothetical protein
LTIVTCGLWSIYALYRNAQKIHAALLSVDPYAKDQSELTLILSLASVRCRSRSASSTAARHPASVLVPWVATRRPTSSGWR